MDQYLLTGCFNASEKPRTKISMKTKERVYGAFDHIFCKLSPLEERVLRMRSGIGFGAGEILTLEEIAHWFNTTKKRIKRIEAAAIVRLERMIKKV